MSLLITLETSDHCLIGYTTKFIYNNNRIILLDHYRSKTMFIFDDSGRLVFRTKKGKGPGEVSDPTAISISSKGSSIYLYERSIREIKEYDFDGNLLGSRKIPNLNIENFLPIEDDKHLVYHVQTPENGGELRTAFSICSESFTNVKPLDIFVKKDQILRAMNPAAISDNKVLFISDYSYDIYELNGNDYFIKYSVDFGNDGLTKEQLENQSDMDLINLVRINNHDVVGRLNSIAFNEEILMFRVEYANDWLAFIYSFSEQRTYNLNNYFNAGLLPKLKVMGIDNGNIYGLVEPEDMISFKELTGGYSNLIIESLDNPLLISFRIKF